MPRVVKGEFIVDRAYQGSRDVALAGLPGGGFAAVWASQDATIYGNPKTQGFDILVQRFGATGKAAGGHPIVNATGFDNQTDPAVTVLSDGRFVVAWQDWSGNARAQIYTAAGAKSGGEITVGASAFSSSADVDVVALSGGGFVVVWDGYARTFNASGVATGSVKVVGGGFDSHAVALSGGGFAVAWEGDGMGDGIHWRLYDASANPTSAIMSAPDFASGFTDAPRIAELSDGNIAVAWVKRDTALGEQPDLPDIHAQVFTRSGTMVGSEIVVNSATGGPQDDVALTALEGGAFVVTWTSRTAPLGQAGTESIEGQIVSAAGVKVGGSFTVTSSQFALERPAVGVLANGNFVVMWDNLVEIRAKIFDPAIGITYAGTSGGDIKAGTKYDDVLAGSAGDDSLAGLSGDDNLAGGAGADTLSGGSGRDTLSGGSDLDRDVFDWNTKTESGKTASTRDFVIDFDPGEDVLDLTGIDASSLRKGNQAFKFIGEAAFHKRAGELHFRAEGGSTIVEGDVNGDGKADFAIELTGALTLTEGDFIL